MKNKTLKKVLYYVVLLILLGVFAFSAYKIYAYYAEKKESTDLNEEIVYEYTVRKTGEAKEYFKVDFDQLWQKNADAVGWLYLPDTPSTTPFSSIATTTITSPDRSTAPITATAASSWTTAARRTFRITTPSFTATTCSTAICSACWWSTRKTAIMRRMTTCTS